MKKWIRSDLIGPDRSQLNLKEWLQMYTANIIYTQQVNTADFYTANSHSSFWSFLFPKIILNDYNLILNHFFFK